MNTPAPSAAYEIFHSLYPCTLAQIHCYHDDYIENIGIGTSGDPDIDKAMYSSRQSLYLTIADMVRLNDQGISVGLQNPRDSISIYSLIQRHLDDWERVLRESINPPLVPIDDLAKMETFAISVHSLASCYNGIIDQTPVFSARERFNPIGSRRSLRRHRFANNSPEPAVAIDPALQRSESIARMAFEKGRVLNAPGE